MYNQTSKQKRELMNTFQITESVLEEYKNNVLNVERTDFLVTQANEQVNEISGNEELYNGFLDKVNAPKKIDNIILWILFMSNEDICSDYIDEFDKDFEDEIPINDLADLLLYIAHLQKFQNIELDGVDYLLEYEAGDIVEVDQHCVTNVLAYIQKSKQVAIEF